MKFTKTLIGVNFAVAILGCSATADSSVNTVTPQSHHTIAPEISALIRAIGRANQDSGEMCKRGDAAFQQQLWKKALEYYRQASAIDPNNSVAWYGQAQCYHALGDTDKELGSYRTAIYSKEPQNHGYRETNIAKLMTFALVLERAGHLEEALTVYNHAADALNYEDGKPNLKVQLPIFDKQSATSYSSEHLQAMADVAIGHELASFQDKEALRCLQEATQLYPDSGIVYYYLAEELRNTGSRDAKATYEKAAQLGDDQVAAAARKAID